jgi:hypothetical protein
MADEILRGGRWWVEGPEGTWHQWNPQSKAWESSTSPPPPPAQAWRMVRAAGAWGAIVALATGATTMILAFNPNLVPSRERTITIRKIKVEPGVTLREYYAHKPVAILHSAVSAARREPSDVDGVVIHFEYVLQGFKRKEKLPFRWTLFDAKSKQRIGESEEMDPYKDLILFAERSQADVGTWELWIDMTNKKAGKYFARIEVYDAPYRNRMTYMDSPVFSMQSSPNASTGR